MANLKLGSSDVKQLLANYESRQRQLQFELDHTKNMIRNLKSALPTIEQTEAEQAAILAEYEVETPVASTEATQPEAKRRGRPAKDKTTTAKPKAAKPNPNLLTSNAVFPKVADFIFI